MKRLLLLFVCLCVIVGLCSCSLKPFEPYPDIQYEHNTIPSETTENAYVHNTLPEQSAVDLTETPTQIKTEDINYDVI